MYFWQIRSNMTRSTSMRHKDRKKNMLSQNRKSLENQGLVTALGVSLGDTMHQIAAIEPKVSPITQLSAVGSYN